MNIDNDGDLARVGYFIAFGSGKPGHNNRTLTQFDQAGKSTMAMQFPACVRHESRPGSMTHVPRTVEVGPDDLLSACAPPQVVTIHRLRCGHWVYPVAWFQCVKCGADVLLTGEGWWHW